MSVSPINTSSVLNNAVSGMNQATAQLDQASQNIANGPGVDPKDVVSLSQASTNFQLNVAVMKSDDKMQKSLLNILT